MSKFKKNSLLAQKIEDRSRKTAKVASEATQHNQRKSAEVLASIFGNPSLPSFPIQKKKKITTTASSLDGISPEHASTSNTKALEIEEGHSLSRADKKRLWIQNRRKDQTYRLEEQKKNTLKKQLKRKNPEMLEQEYIAKSKKRKDPTVKQKIADNMRDKRKDPQMKEKEKEHKRLIRADPKIKEKEIERKKVKRSDPQIREKEKEHKRVKRTEPQIKEKEKEHKRLKRTEPQIKEKEKEHKRVKRTEPQIKEKEKEHKRLKRTEPQIKEKEKEHKRVKRSDPQIKEKEKEQMRMKRIDPKMKEKEKEHKRVKRTEPQIKEKEKEQMRMKRIDPKMKEKEKEHKRVKRTEPQIKEKEKEQMRMKRIDLKMKEKEKEHKRIKRTEPQIKEKEKEHKRVKRTEPQFKEKEKEHKRIKRTEPQIKEKEKEHKRVKRTEPQFKEKEKEHKRVKRTEPQFKEKEKEHKRVKRTEPQFKEKEKEYKQIKRKEPEVNCKEREYQRSKRSDPIVRNREREHKRKKRKNPVVTEQEKQQKREQRKGRKPRDFTALVQIFQNKVEEGPVYICTCCKQLMYRHSVVQTSKATIKTTKTQILEQLIDSCITETKSVDGKEWICRTCFKYLKKSTMPPSAVANKMEFPKQGPLKHLNPLELTLLSPLLPFMKIHQATTGQQYKIHGNMVVVPSDTINTVQSLPRVSSNTSTIKAKLKRRLRYEHHVYSQNIRPEEIRAAAKYLSETGDLYRSLNITYNLDWSETNIPAASTLTDDTPNDRDQYNENTTPDDVNASESTELNDTTPDSKDNPVDSDEEWNEVDTHENTAGSTDTLLTAPDFIESGERDLVYSYAPAENRQPVSIFTEKTAEEQSYPGIFCGQSRISNESRTVPVTYGEIVKSELRNSDRRCAKTVENIFFKTKKLQMKFLIDQTNIAVRKIKTGGQQLTAKDVRTENAQNLIQLDQGYKVLRTLRGSPPYFQAISKDLFAMIRQLGPATFFCTLSAAETQWIHLLRILGKLIDDKEYTDDELENLTWQEKSRLIQSDPVTCTRHFDYSLQCFMNHFILTDLNPIGKVTDWFYRIEFQQRGSPHVHMMLWCTDAPNIDEDSQEDICTYIDKYVTCSLPTEENELSKLVKLQTHKHSRTCKKKGKKQCRFGFPKPPLKNTRILRPLLPDDEDKNEHLKVWKQIHDALILLQDGEDITYEEFLKRLDIQENQYINAIRSSISTATVFLKRSPKEIRVNSYSAVCLQAWRANMDLQFVIDVYACAIYIASYVTKTQRGMSELLRNACKEANVGNKTIKEQVRLIGNKFLNAVEISAQEACYLSLQLPLKRSSRQAIFINTSPPDQRVILLKPQNQLSSMDDDDEEIECKNLLKRYAERPKSMEKVTLAEFGSSYERCKSVVTSRAKSLCKATRDGLLPDPPQYDDDSEDTTREEDEENDGPSTSKKQASEYRQRKKQKIIRSVHFNLDTDPENYYRELLMLYFPWRDEVKDLIGKCTSYTARYGEISQEIEEHRQKYEPFRSAVHEAETFIAEQPDLEQAWDTVAPNTQHQDQQDKAHNPSSSNDAQPGYDIGPDLGLRASAVEDMNSYNELTDHEFRKHMRFLNQQQIQFIYDVIHQIKTQDTPIFRFLSGGAGVGKSFVTKALYQMILKYYNRKAGDDFTTPKVLLMAPTGKAAYHIHGNTIHSTFRIPVNQKLQHKSLDSSSFNTLQNTLGNVKLIFIDEISMVGYKLLNCIHQRLMELKRSKSVFGGVSVIAVGDLFQLKPVMDSYIFQTPKSDYMPLATNLWEENFTMTELDIIMRQRDNKQFAELLNRLREGNHTTEDIQLLKTNIIEPDAEDYPYDVPHVFITNERVNSYNADVFLRTKSSKFTLKAKDRVLGNYSQEVMNKILESFAAKTKDIPQLATTVQLAEQLTYEITINLDCEDGLINGASCKLMKLKLTDLTYASGLLWVKFYDENTGHHLRQSKKHLYTPDVEQNWTPIEPTTRQYSAGYKGEAQIQRLQFPIRPSAAKTVHRSQGDTVENIVVDLTTNRKIDHIHYVALSRVTAMKGLNIRQLQEDKISINKSVQQEMERLRAVNLVPSLKFLYLLPEKFKIIFLNANSLNKHLMDVKSDFSITSADIVAFCETRFIPSDNTSIPNFHCYRQDFTAQTQHLRSPYGLAVYSKEAHPSGYPKNINSKTTEMLLTEIQNPVPNLQLIFLYKPPKTEVDSLIKHLKTIHSQHLQRKPAIIMGDFNTDWSKQNAAKNKLLAYFQSISYRQLVLTPTTDDNTTIDLIFTNLPEEDIQSGTLEVYYSPHKPIWIGI